MGGGGEVGTQIALDLADVLTEGLAVTARIGQTGDVGGEFQQVIRPDLLEVGHGEVRVT